MPRRLRIKLCSSIFFMLLLLSIAIFSDILAPYDPVEQNLMLAKQAPSLTHLFGTDLYGRDMLSRVLVGSKVSIFSALSTVILMVAFGTMVGIFCGYIGGWVDTILMRTSDIFLAFPGLVLAIAAAGLFANGIYGAILALAAVGWPKYARLARGLVLSVKTSIYVNAARLSGSSNIQIIFFEILPNIIGQIVVTASLDIGTSLMELAGLSFLGLGAAPPTPEWGSMMSESRSLLQITPWITLAPGIGIFITVTVFNLFGEALRDFYGERA